MIHQHILFQKQILIEEWKTREEWELLQIRNATIKNRNNNRKGKSIYQRKRLQSGFSFLCLVSNSKSTEHTQWTKIQHKMGSLI